MQLNLFQSIVNEIKKVEIGDFIKEISERFNKMEEELVIDRFEGNVVICQDRKTGKIKEIARENIEKGLKEGSFIKEEKGKYVLAREKQEEIENRIKDKMKQVWKD